MIPAIITNAMMTRKGCCRIQWRETQLKKRKEKKLASFYERNQYAVTIVTLREDDA